MPLEENWTAWKQGAAAESKAGSGVTTVVSLSPHTNLGYLAIEKNQPWLPIACLLLEVRDSNQ